LQLKLPNGDMLIYGNVRQTVVAPGSNVVGGQLIGYSGSMNGAHLHLEYRVRDASLPAGWRIIDPRSTSLNGLPVSIESFSAASPAP
jgi:murein DD-endopeptidase MepM/ murein hydrolase activator NlpD